MQALAIDNADTISALRTQVSDLEAQLEVAMASTTPTPTNADRAPANHNATPTAYTSVYNSQGTLRGSSVTISINGQSFTSASVSENGAVSGVTFGAGESAQDWIDGFESGYNAGFDDGYEAGYADGFADGVASMN